MRSSRSAPSGVTGGAGLPVGRRRSGEQGLVMMAVLGMVLVLVLLAALVLFVAGKEASLASVRMNGAQGLYVAEGGAVAGRAALMAYIGVYPVGVASVDSSLTSATASNWYASGVGTSQSPFGLLNYLVVDGQKLTVNAAASSVPLQVNWGLGTAHLKLQTAGTPANTLGTGSYTASVVLTPNPTADASCSGGPCAIHQLGPDYYEIFYGYTVTSQSSAGTFARRAVTLSGNFSVQLRLHNFAMYALFTNVQTTPGGSAIWFNNNTSFSGPVHTNGEFQFAFFPTFTDKVESVATKAWFNNTGSPIELANTENVQNGTRVDAPLVPPASNPQSAPPANFTLGAPTVPLPTGPYNQQGVAIGLNPGNTGQVTTGQIDAAIPELKNSGTVPNGIYVPVTDSNGNCSSDTGKPMLGGIFVQGDLDSLTLSVAGSTAVYTLGQGSTTTTVTVDRTNNQTTVSSNGWLPPSSAAPCPGGAVGPSTRTFTGVPKGWQGAGNSNGTIVYVQGNVNALSGTLQQNEQTTIAASGTITITGNVQYQSPPNPSDPTSNPTNVLGLYSSGGDIVIGSSAPNNVTIQAVLMAGSAGSSYHSSVTVAGYNTGSPRGTVNLLGGMIEKYYGAFGTFNAQTGTMQTGYGRNFTFDTRMGRGFNPPYFPTTNQFMVVAGSQPLAGVKPTWREATPH
jgi:hypothetical protein